MWAITSCTDEDVKFIFVSVQNRSNAQYITVIISDIYHFKTWNKRYKHQLPLYPERWLG